MRVRAYLPAVSVAVLALVAASTSLGNQFAYDDRFIVLLNGNVHTLHHWWGLFAQSYWPKSWSGDGYRPITMIAFAVEWAIGRGSPMLFHATNILLAVTASVLAFYLVEPLFPLWAAWSVAALFAVDPVHVEAVANVVGQAELLVAVFVLAATVLYLRDRRTGDGTVRPRTGAAIVLLYLAACFSKEHGIVLPAILAAAEVTIIADARPLVERARKLRLLYLGLALAALAFVAVRARVLSDHGIGGFAPFTPFSALKLSTRDRILTAVTVVPQWIRLLLWPQHLSSEYGPPGLEIAQGFSITQLPGLVLFLAVVALAAVLRRRRPEVSFGIAFVCIALLPSSNFILPAGIMLAERTLYLPSVGAMIAAGGFAVMAAAYIQATQADATRVARTRRWVQAVFALVLVAATVRSMRRAPVWNTTETVFRQAVIDSPDAYRAHFMLGTFAFEQNDKALGEAEYHRALRLFPYDPGMSYSLAEQYRQSHMCKEAIPFYRWTRQLAPDFMGRTSYAECFLEVAQFDSARVWILAAMKVGGDMPLLRQMLAYADSAKKAENIRTRPHSN